MIGDLSLVRALGLCAIPVAVASSEPGSPTTRSRYCKAVIPIPSFVDAPGRAVTALVAWARTQRAKPVLFYQGDHDLLALSRARAELEPHLCFVLPSADLVEDLVDKVRFAALAERLSLPVPPTHVVLRGPAAGSALLGWNHFPCVLKPAMRTHWFDSPLVERAAGSNQKALRIEDRRELERLWPLIEAHASDFILQAAVEGGEERILSYHAYVRPGGQIVAELTGKKLRTWPRRHGLSTCVEITDDARIKALGQLRALRPHASRLVCGHTHQPMLYARGGGLLAFLPNAELRVPSEGPCVVNPGAVGQARDRDPLARYALFDVDERTISYVALSYDHALTLRKLRAHGLVARVAMPPPTGVARRIEGLKAEATRHGKAAAMARPDVPLPGPTARRMVLGALHHALARTGEGTAFMRSRRPDGAMILVYHGIVTEDEERWVDPRFSVPARVFGEQMRFLARQRRVWGLADLLEALSRGAPIPAGSVVVTFDDGYRNVLDVAAPILERYDIPAVLYLATGYVSRGESQPADVLYGAFKQRTHNVLALSDGTVAPVRLSAPAVVRATYLSLQARLLRSSAAERAQLLDEIVERLQPAEPQPRLTLTWDEVARLRTVWPRIEVGAHTRDHVDLSACSSVVATREVAASVDDVKSALGTAPAHFAYPYGRSDPAARSAVAGTALLSAVVTEPAALVRKGSDRLALPRLSAPRDMSLFSFLTSGAYPDLPLALFGRA